MNKLLKILLAIGGGVDVLFTFFTPILICLLWINQNGTQSFGSLLIYGLGLVATLFRAVKVGFFK